MRPIAALLTAVVSVAALAACGGETSTRSAPETSVAGADVTVVVDDHDYEPEHVEISAGQTVGWNFQDRMDHDVAFDDGPASPIQREGTWTRTFDEPGTYEYLCTLHPSMTGTVTVTADASPPPPTTVEDLP